MRNKRILLFVLPLSALFFAWLFLFVEPSLHPSDPTAQGPQPSVSAAEKSRTPKEPAPPPQETVSPQEPQEPAEPAPAPAQKTRSGADKESILKQLSAIQQNQLKEQLAYLQNFPFFMEQLPLIGKYRTMDAFKKTEGSRADEILAQRDTALAGVEQTRRKLHNQYRPQAQAITAFLHGIYHRVWERPTPQPVSAKPIRGQGSPEKVLRELRRAQEEQNKSKAPAYDKPDLQKIFKGKRVIFIWESGGHSHLKPVIDNQQEIYTAIRNAYPNKRIVLAHEALKRMEIGDIPSSALITQPDNYRTPVMRFAGEEQSPNLRWSAPGLNQVGETANTLGIDVLALDDVSWQQSWLFNIFKVGNRSVPVPVSQGANDLILRWHASNWGIQQRNHQWSSYVRAVAPYYDVIIVHAGSAHYGIKKLLKMKQDAVMDVFVDKLTLEEVMSDWHINIEKQRGRSEQESRNKAQQRAEAAKKFQGNLYHLEQENGRVNLLYIIIP